MRLPETSRTSAVKGSAIVEQIAIEMKAYVGLKTLREAFEHAVHVDAVGVGPGMLKVLLQSLTQGIWDLMELNEFPHS